jgi:hypothetical protein
MDRGFSFLKRWLPVAGAVAAVSCAQAQSLMRPGQAIIFSSPDDNADSSSPVPPAAEPPAAPGFADMVHAPQFNFPNPSTPVAQLPAPVPAAVPPVLDSRADWALMTPAEILGVDTPDQILKIPDRDAAGLPKKTTVVERYLERQDQVQTNGSGAFLSATPSLRPDFSGNEDARFDSDSFKPAGSIFANPAHQPAESFQQAATGTGTDAGQNTDPGWTKVFASTPAPAESPAQAADMTEFKKLLEPSQPLPSSKPAANDGIFSSQHTLQGSKFGQPANAGDATFGPFNAIGGLPEVRGQVSAPTVTAVPDWKPQSPPWMLKGPQPDVIPKRVVF